MFTKRKVKDNEYDGAEKKCYGDIPLPFKAGNETINYPKVCIGDSIDDEKNECPYGCYYIGEGEFLPNCNPPSGAPQPAGPRRRIQIMGKNVKITEVY